MPEQHEQEITEALAALSRGAPEAMDRLMPLVYRELKRIAHRQLGAESRGHTLSTTAVVHEAYLRLAEQTHVEWASPGQFFALAARAMRRVLIDYARQHRAARRGGPDRTVVPLDLLEHGDSAAISIDDRADSLLALDEALEGLRRMDERLARVVECRFFAGLTEVETSEALGVSQRTVSRDWQMARAWLHEALRRETA
ncbi:RNA polymerase sigma factor [Gemmatirosa kalamazoonensis]|uniref:RNA polymerase sigma factor n=1 Tax=Gemmatirosa kalamazoonensis TaxID=861299 RepID=W0RCP5_9BACT|nr:ECF-type sigma factor [Gemmatirosa kalamazoonensis]AHG88571.1 RNA polymerase sigma factor [Gemmatirosa kalamazoonensis]